jgi:hypothetical protein
VGETAPLLFMVRRWDCGSVEIPVAFACCVLVVCSHCERPALLPGTAPGSF